MLSNAFDREKNAFQAGGGDLDRAKYQFQTVNCGPGGSQCPGQAPTFVFIFPTRDLGLIIAQTIMSNFNRNVNALAHKRCSILLLFFVRVSPIDTLIS